MPPTRKELQSFERTRLTTEIKYLERRLASCDDEAEREELHLKLVAKRAERSSLGGE